MPFNLREYHCDRIQEEVSIGDGGRRGIRVHCPYYNYNRNLYSLKINRVCSANFPENETCMVLELMIKEIMKERSRLTR